MSLNQIGIIMNFLAGLLLAPQIFGEDKLISWGKVWVNFLIRPREKLLKTVNALVDDLEDEKPLAAFRKFLGYAIAFLSFIMWAVVNLTAVTYMFVFPSQQAVINRLQEFLHTNPKDMDEMYLLFFFIFFLLSLMLFAGIFYLHLVMNQKLNIRLLLISIAIIVISLLSIANKAFGITILWIVTFPFIIITPVVLFSIIVGLLGIILESLMLSLSRHEGLKGIFTALGVISFFLGSILQFIAG
jgi:hypothetical protein